MAINLDLMPVQNGTAKQGLQGIEQAIYQVAKVLGGETKWDWKSIKAVVDAGRAGEFFSLGDEISVKNAYDVLISATTGSATIDGHEFIVAMNETRSKPYIFTYDGTNWLDENKSVVVLANIGITYTGTPSSGSQIEVLEECFDVEYLVGRANKDRLTLIPAKAQFPQTIMFDAAEYMFAKAEILPAGTYYFKLASNNTYYSFTTTQDTPVGGGFRINNRTAPTTLTTFNSPLSTTTIESLTITNEGTTDPENGTFMGTVGNGNDAAGTGANGFYVNTYNRQQNGSNNYVDSNFRQWLNSDKAKGSWYAQSNPLDRCNWASSYNGFLWGLDPSFVTVVGKKERTFIGANCDSNQVYSYSDLFYLLTNKEVMFTTYADEEEHLPYFELFTTTPADNSTILNNERRRTNYVGTGFNYYWLSTADRSTSCGVCYVSNYGYYDGNFAYNYTGVCAACDILAENN